MPDTTTKSENDGELPEAVSNLYQLKSLHANERAVAAGIVEADNVALPDRTHPGYKRRRPVRSGCGIGPRGTWYGTMGFPVKVTATTDLPEWMHWNDSVSRGEVLYTTDRHVLDGDLGDPVFQPGHITTERNRIGALVGYAELLVEDAPDVAFIRLAAGIEWDGYLHADGMGAGVYRGDGADIHNTPSRLAGANSGVATGEITGGPMAAVITYSGHGSVTKRELLRATDNSRGGDSGAPSDSGPENGSEGGVLRGLNFASQAGFLDGGASWKLPVRLIERAGVRVLSNDEHRRALQQRQHDEASGDPEEPAEPPEPKDSERPDEPTTTTPETTMRELKLKSTGDGEQNRYAIETTGHFEGVDDDTRVIEDGTVAAEEIYGGTDTYRFDGVIVDATLDRWGDAKVLIDGERYYPGQLVAGELTIRSAGDHGASYMIAASGSVQHVDPNAEDHTIDGVAYGGVGASGSDTVRYTGVLQGIDCDQPISVTGLGAGDDASADDASETIQPSQRTSRLAGRFEDLF